MSLYLPDGCTQDEIDRLCGGYDAADEDDGYPWEELTPDLMSLFETEAAA